MCQNPIKTYHITLSPNGPNNACRHSKDMYFTSKYIFTSLSFCKKTVYNSISCLSSTSKLRLLHTYVARNL
uniref:Putative ovule protein n=1 Tax=Solanum chacoense TaxID=4108 RepID=A0A0V0H5Q9_SOLCH